MHTDYMEIRNRIERLLSKKTNWGRVELMKELDLLFMELISEKLKEATSKNNIS